MAITRTASQVLWSSASTKSVTSATEVVSDVVTLDATCVSLAITVSADNAGTPASGDTAVWRIQWSTGDVLADTGDDYDTSEHAQYLTVLDTYATNTPGEDPARRTIIVDVVAQKFKLAVTCANAATRNVTVAARIEEQRAA
jgi:hypothetical protein